MEIQVTRLNLQNEHKRLIATVHYYDEQNTPHSSGSVEVFVPMEDSHTIGDIKNAAIEKAQAFLNEAISSEGGQGSQR